MSRAGGHVNKAKKQAPGMDLSKISDGLRAGLEELDIVPVQSKTDSSVMLAKILKDTAKREHIEKEAIRLEEERANAEDSDDEEDAASRAAADARQQQTEEAAKDIERRKAASNGPPIFAQVLFPTDTPQLACELSAELPIVEACAEMMGSDAGAVDLTQELIVGGWLQQHYQRVGGMPSGCQRDLFSLATGSEDLALSRQAFLTLNSVLSSPPNPRPGLYSQSPEVNASECELDDGLFKEAFKRLGVADVAAANKQSKALEAKQKAGSADTDTDMKDANQSADAELAGWSDSSRPPLFQHLQHTLILLATVARAQAAGKGSSLRGMGSLQLLVTVLSLRLDPAACLLYTELEDAAMSVIESVDDSDWSLKFTTTVTQLATIGGSFRGVVETLRYLSQQNSPRARALCNHTAAHLIPTLLQLQGQVPTKARKSRGVEEVNPEDILKGLKWYNNDQGAQNLVSELRLGKVSSWEFRAVMELMDLVLWPHIRASHLSGEPAKYADFVERWHRYCHKVSTLVKKDEEGMAINLLSTTLATRNKVST